MMQRKLTQDELQNVEKAAWHLRRVSSLGSYPTFAAVVLDGLDELATHGTNDGKPWVEPQPEIGDGYRVATVADLPRPDIEYFSNLRDSGWFVRAAPTAALQSSYHYRVPIDRIPTDEDARERPTVMVASHPEGEWHSRRLLGVTAMGFLVASGDGFTSWKHCRFPYPGELP